MLRKARLYPTYVSRRTVLRALRSWRQFDERVTAPLHGYGSAEEYYRCAGCARFLPHIRRPTLVLAATDDPLIPGTTIPYAAFEANPYLTLVVSSSGGHCGFVSGPPWRPRFWAEQQAVLWLSRLLAAAGARGGPSEPAPGRLGGRGAASRRLGFGRHGALRRGRPRRRDQGSAAASRAARADRAAARNARAPRPPAGLRDR
ncbi:MAG: hypothetical protein KatS3mg102_3019 [Planctomycetota bacterium]|nr:MAG: hypothetical protein KatS3mg102_3019 [Planctomycetota bacterium]